MLLPRTPRKSCFCMGSPLQKLPTGNGVWEKKADGIMFLLKFEVLV